MQTSFKTLDDQYKSGYIVCISINQGWSHSLALGAMAPLKFEKEIVYTYRYLFSTFSN